MAVNKNEETRKKFMEEVMAERKRQIERKRFTAAHDDKMKNGELARAAAFYALPEEERLSEVWPFTDEECKPDPENRRKELVKAAALIVAEAERLERL